MSLNVNFYFHAHLAEAKTLDVLTANVVEKLQLRFHIAGSNGDMMKSVNLTHFVSPYFVLPIGLCRTTFDATRHPFE